MAEINLLKQKTTGQSFWEVFPSILVKVFLVIGIAVVAYYVYLYIRVKKTTSNLVAVQQQIVKDKAEAANIKGRDELLTRQSQLQQLDSLIDNHVYWTHVLPELARVTLKTASYSDIKASANGSIVLSAKVPNLLELDKFMQVFNIPEYNRNFSNVRLGSYHIAQDGPTSSIAFEVRMDYNTQILQYKDPNAAK